MGDTGFIRYPGCLDPRAEEFRPTFPYSTAPPQFFIPYPAPPFLHYTQVLPPPPPPTPYVTHSPPHFICNSPPPHVNNSPPPAYFSISPQPYISNSPRASFNNSLPVHVSGSPSAIPVQYPQAQVRRNPPPARLNRPAEATRTISLSSVSRGVSETDVRRELEFFGDVRAVQMERARREGIVIVHFYDLRHAVEAVREVDMQNGRVVLGGAVRAQFVTPNMAGVPDGYNQGTLVVFNLNPRFSNNDLKLVFEPFGDVKELRETPIKCYQRFIEFYDIRDASKAYSHLNGKEICGNQIVIEFSRPGGYKKHIQKTTSKNSNTRSQPPLTRQTSSNSKKPSSHGSSNSSEKCFQKQNLKREKQVASGNPKNTSKNKGWSHKARQERYLDSRFLINEDGVVDSSVSDPRTTVMIKNIPNKYSQKLLMNMLDNHCIHCNEKIASNGCDEPLSSYDFIYLPIDFINKCNVGYGFVNLTSPVAALRLYNAFHHQTWEVYNSKKICEVTYARLQGLEVLKEHFRNSKFPCTAEEYLPVVFSPPRDGRQLTDPLPVAARVNSVSSSNNKEGEDTTNSSNRTLTDDDGNENDADSETACYDSH